MPKAGLRWGVAALFVLTAGTWVVRSTIVERSGGVSYAARGAWPSHPEVLSSSVMEEVGRAAGRGEEPGPRVMAAVEQLAVEQPFSPFPFLVHGALAVRRGDYERGEMLLREARQRAPRAPAARYMLADLYLRTGRPLPAMGEMAVLNRLVPGTAAQLAPALAAYAGTPGAPQQLKAILGSYPELEPQLLVQLAASGGDRGLILTLASRGSANAASRAWQSSVLNSMMARRDYPGAYAVWARFADVEPKPWSLFNPSFASIEAPPPFNWDLAQGSGGLAEPQNGSLQVLYYGREDLSLASQTLLLEPGRYRLAMNIKRQDGDPQGIHWKLSCIGLPRPILDMPLGTGNRFSGEFTVPAGCLAQKLELQASAKDFGERAQFSIGALELTRL